MTDNANISDNEIETQIEAKVLRRLIAHLQNRSDVQNIDLMILSGFCRNCLSRWYREAAEEAGLSLDDDTAKKRIYGMTYEQWKKQYQTEASPEQLAQMKALD